MKVNRMTKYMSNNYIKESVYHKVTKKRKKNLLNQPSSGRTRGMSKSKTITSEKKSDVKLS